MTDAWTVELVERLPLKARRIIFPVSRLVVDPERLPNDDEEPMALKGMGAIYTKLSSGEHLRNVSAADRAILMDAYYYPHHQDLTAAVDSAVRESDCCLIIDVHSFSSSPLPHEDQSIDRAEICIGFDAFHTPFPGDVDIISICNRLGFSSSVNRPFGGSIVPSKFWGIIRLTYHARHVRIASELKGSATWPAAEPIFAIRSTTMKTPRASILKASCGRMVHIARAAA